MYVTYRDIAVAGYKMCVRERGQLRALISRETSRVFFGNL